MMIAVTISFQRFHQGRRGATAAGAGAGSGAAVGSVMGEKVRDRGSPIQSPGGREGKALPYHEEAAEPAPVLPVPAGHIHP